MAFAFKTIVTAATLFAASAVHAEWQFVSGTGSLNFSETGISAIDQSGAFPFTNGDPKKANLNYESNILTLGLTSSTAVGDQIHTATSTGSSFHMELTRLKYGTPYLDQLITMSDFVFDLGTRTVSAQVTATDLLRNVSTSYGLLPIFSAASVVGGEITAGNAQSGVATFSTVGPLTMNSATVNTLVSVFATPAMFPYPFDTVSNVWKTTDWGTFSGQVTLSAVPEPSSAGLMLLGGLAVLGAVRARRRHQAI